LRKEDTNWHSHEAYGRDIAQRMPAILLGDFNTPAESGELILFFRAAHGWIPFDERILMMRARHGSAHNSNFRQKPGTPTPYDFCVLITNAILRIDFIFVNEAIPMIASLKAVLS